ncbi:hypothetical protein [Desertivirga xinjiangensis]|uniref:hypothetical protein n=1 Tax=Desertivirga xinjiangensis TaxID=539206 RepID=UPI00210EFF15|nr:hypothetical protein [Pedobacter xinjiangensis]
MQGMSDDNFDKLFKDKFSAFEGEPSGAVWKQINSKLQGKNDRKFPLFWIAAASIVAVLFAFLWLIPSKEPVKLYGAKKPSVEAQAPVVLEEKLSAGLYREPVKPSGDYKVISQPGKKRVQVTAKIPVRNRVGPDYKEGSTLEDNESGDILTVTVGLPTEAGSLRETSIASADLLVLRDTSVTAPAVEEPRSKQKIKTVGDLVNFVVSKVDKRKNKIIEFSKEDEGDVVSGLNLGVLQYKTQNR